MKSHLNAKNANRDYSTVKVKTTGSVPSAKKMTKWKFSDATNSASLNYQVEQPKFNRVELTENEKIIYHGLFGEEGRKVSKPLKECLEEFTSLGLHRNPEHLDVIEVAHKCIDGGFDSVEKSGFHVINDETDAEVLCRYRENGEWRFIACIERELIRKFKKNMNSAFYFDRTYVANSGGGYTNQIGNSTTIGYTVK